MAKTKFYILTVLIAIICIVAIFDSMTGSVTGVCYKYTTDQVALGADLADEFGNELNRNDICLFDGKVNINGDSANTQEILMLNHRGRDLGPATALTANKEYNDIVLEADKESVKLYYVFDNSIDLTRVSLDSPMETKFLGNSFKIARVNSDTSFLAYVGDEYMLTLADSVIVNGKTVRLVKVGQNGAIIVSVDGQTEMLSRGSTETVNGIEITNVESFYDSENIFNNLAELIVGEESLLTIRDGDYYDNTTDWQWNVGGLTTAASTVTSSTSEFSGPYFGIENRFEYDSTSDIITKGECISLPDNYVSICFNGTTSVDYVDLEIDTDSVDLTEHGLGSSESGMHWKTSSNALRLGGTRTNEAWLVGGVLYYERSGSIIDAGFDGTNIGTIERLSITKSGNQYTIDSPIAADDVTFVYTSSLGIVQWNARTVDEDDGKLITKYGVIISDIDDELELKIPDRQVRAEISIISTSA